jgi:hypothetical protein
MSPHAASRGGACMHRRNTRSERTGRNSRVTRDAWRTKMLQRSLILALLLAAVPSIGFAQGMSERERGDKACRGDVGRLCRKVMDQGEGAVLNCLQNNEKKLSRGCRKVLEDNGQL